MGEKIRRLKEFVGRNFQTAENVTDVILPEIRLYSNEAAVIDGCTAVSEYDENVICFNCGRINVRFTGEAMVIKELDGDTGTLCGKIFSVEFFN